MSKQVNIHKFKNILLCVCVIKKIKKCSGIEKSLTQNRPEPEREFWSHQQVMAFKAMALDQVS